MLRHCTLYCDVYVYVCTSYSNPAVRSLTTRLTQLRQDLAGTRMVNATATATGTTAANANPTTFAFEVKN